MLMDLLLEYTVTVINLLLCLSYKLSFTIGLFVAKLSDKDKVFCYLRFFFLVSTECPGIHPLQERGLQDSTKHTASNISPPMPLLVSTVHFLICNPIKHIIEGYYSNVTYLVQTQPAPTRNSLHFIPRFKRQHSMKNKLKI